MLKIIIIGICCSFHLIVEAQTVNKKFYTDIEHQWDTTVTRRVGDVRVIHQDESYVIEFCTEYQKKAVPFRARVESEKIFDKAIYMWQTAGKVIVRLYNSDNDDDLTIIIISNEEGFMLGIDDSPGMRRRLMPK